MFALGSGDRLDRLVVRAVGRREGRGDEDEEGYSHRVAPVRGSGEDAADDAAGDVGQAVVAAVVREREASVIEPEQVEDGRM